MHGIENLLIHIENLKKFGPPVVVCLNKFPSDTAAQLKQIKMSLYEKNIPCEISEGFEKGAEGAECLAQTVVEQSKNTSINFTYSLNQTIKDKVETIAKNIYRAGNVDWSSKAQEKLDLFHSYSSLPICMAKTPLSLTDNTKCEFQLDKHTIHIRDLKLQAGAGFIVPLTGETRLMPGLPKEPRALNVDLSDHGSIIWD